MAHPTGTQRSRCVLPPPPDTGLCHSPDDQEPQLTARTDPAAASLGLPVPSAPLRRLGPGQLYRRPLPSRIASVHTSETHRRRCRSMRPRCFAKTTTVTSRHRSTWRCDPGRDARRAVGVFKSTKGGRDATQDRDTTKTRPRQPGMADRARVASRRAGTRQGVALVFFGYLRLQAYRESRRGARQ